MLAQAIHFSIVLDELRLHRVYFNSDTESLAAELNNIAADASKCIHHVDSDIRFLLLLLAFKQMRLQLRLEDLNDTVS